METVENPPERPETLIPFDLLSPCPKCEGRGMDGRYCTSFHAGNMAYDELTRQAPEHLDLTCQWCGHTRYMATADSVKPVHERIVSG